MILKIIIWVITKIVGQIIYSIIKNCYCDNSKRGRCILVGCGIIITLVTYKIFQAAGFKHPIIFTALATVLWNAMLDTILGK